MVTPQELEWREAKRANTAALSKFMGGYVPISTCDEAFDRLLTAEAALMASIDERSK